MLAFCPGNYGFISRVGPCILVIRNSLSTKCRSKLSVHLRHQYDSNWSITDVFKLLLTPENIKISLSHPITKVFNIILKLLIFHPALVCITNRILESLLNCRWQHCRGFCSSCLSSSCYLASIIVSNVTRCCLQLCEEIIFIRLNNRSWSFWSCFNVFVCVFIFCVTLCNFDITWNTRRWNWDKD